MSDAKPLKKAETTPKKAEAPKPAATTSDATKTETPAASASTSSATPGVKSAAQQSISHFSSVSTPEYRSGWENIFGSKKKTEEAVSNEDADPGLPAKLTLNDVDIDADLRALLDKAFELAALKNGIDLAKVKKTPNLAYSIDCEIL